MRFIAILIAVVCLVPVSAPAQDSRYSTWADPTARDSAGARSLDAFIEKLNKLIDEAEKANAADPVFLQDLRTLANGARTPWNTVVLDDSFADGNFTSDPAWEVLSGKYFIETGWGLRNRLITAQQSQQPSDGDDFAKAILGTILKRATGQQDGADEATSNVIVTRTNISNAFSLEIELSSWGQGGNFDVGVFQGENATLGYRLLYAAGKGVQLHRVGGSGSSVIATSEPLNLEDKKFHTVTWTRGTGGQMRVTVDGNEMIAAADRAFSDPFDGVRISNTSGDFIVKRITAKGI